MIDTPVNARQRNAGSQGHRCCLIECLRKS
jgi:hypothetical protein